MSEEAQAPAEPSARKKGKGKLIVVALALVLSVGGGAYWWTHGATAEVTGGEAKAAEHAGGGVVALDPFVVNLADRQSSRYLRVTLRLVLDEEDHAKEMEESPVRLMRARSAILELLTQQLSDPLVTPEGKAQLKKAIVKRMADVLGHQQVTDVLFADFVVQF